MTKKVYKTVKVEKENGITWVILNRPEKRNAMKRIGSSGAEAAIVTAAKMCEPGLEEQVAYSHTLDHNSVPYFVSEFEENMTSFDHLEIQLETFVENLLFA